MTMTSPTALSLPRDNNRTRHDAIKKLLLGSSPKNPIYILSQVLADFQSQGASELTVYKGEEIYILFEINDWAFVTSLKDSSRRGYIPLDFCDLVKDFYSFNPRKATWHETAKYSSQPSLNTLTYSNSQIKRVLFSDDLSTAKEADLLLNNRRSSPQNDTSTKSNTFHTNSLPRSFSQPKWSMNGINPRRSRERYSSEPYLQSPSIRDALSKANHIGKAESDDKHQLNQDNNFLLHSAAVKSTLPLDDVTSSENAPVSTEILTYTHTSIDNAGSNPIQQTSKSSEYKGPADQSSRLSPLLSSSSKTVSRKPSEELKASSLETLHEANELDECSQNINDSTESNEDVIPKAETIDMVRLVEVFQKKMERSEKLTQSENAIAEPYKSSATTVPSESTNMIADEKNDREGFSKLANTSASCRNQHVTDKVLEANIMSEVDGTSPSNHLCDTRPASSDCQERQNRCDWISADRLEDPRRIEPHTCNTEAQTNGHPPVIREKKYISLETTDADPVEQNNSAYPAPLSPNALYDLLNSLVMSTVKQSAYHSVTPNDKHSPLCCCFHHDCVSLPTTQHKPFNCKATYLHILSCFSQIQNNQQSRFIIENDRSESGLGDTESIQSAGDFNLDEHKHESASTLKNLTDNSTQTEWEELKFAHQDLQNNGSRGDSPFVRNSRLRQSHKRITKTIPGRSKSHKDRSSIDSLRHLPTLNETQKIKFTGADASTKQTGLLFTAQHQKNVNDTKFKKTEEYGEEYKQLKISSTDEGHNIPYDDQVEQGGSKSENNENAIYKPACYKQPNELEYQYLNLEDRRASVPDLTSQSALTRSKKNFKNKPRRMTISGTISGPDLQLAQLVNSIDGVYSSLSTNRNQSEETGSSDDDNDLSRKNGMQFWHSWKPSQEQTTSNHERQSTRQRILHEMKERFLQSDTLQYGYIQSIQSGEDKSESLSSSNDNVNRWLENNRFGKFIDKCMNEDEVMCLDSHNEKLLETGIREEELII